MYIQLYMVFILHNYRLLSFVIEPSHPGHTVGLSLDLYLLEIGKANSVDHLRSLTSDRQDTEYCYTKVIIDTRMYSYQYLK